MNRNPGVARIWLTSALLAVPFTVLAHEFGHYVAALTFGFGNVRLHGMETSYDAANYPTAQRVIVSGVGAVVSYLLTILSFGARRRRPVTPERTALLTTVGFAASMRGALWLVIAAAIASGQRVVPGGDEASVARLLGMPLWPGVLVSFGLFVGAFYGLVLAIQDLPQGRRWGAWVGTLVGYGIGWAIQLLVIVPMLA